jgi:transcriptional regulator with XRE-family HTH domain
MARSVITSEQWERAKEYFEHGLSLSDISERTGISRGAISKKSKSEEWGKETPKKQLLSQAVEVTKGKNALKETPVALEVHNELHNEHIRRENLIYGNAEKLASKLLTMADQIDTPNDLKTLSEANDKLAITLKVADRHAPKIDVTQLQQQGSTTTTVEIIEDKVE